MLDALSRFVMKLTQPYGFFFLRRLWALLPYKALQRHMYISGRTGSGKTEFLKVIFYRLQRDSAKKRNKSLILIDPHGDLAEELLLFDLNRDDMSRIVYVDPLAPDYKITLNPLEIYGERDVDTVTVRTEQLVTAIDEIVGDAKLSVYMKAVLTPCVSTLLFKGDATLVDLQSFLDDDRNEDLVTLGMQNPIPSHARFFRTEDFFDKKYAGTKTSVKTRLQAMLNYPKFYDLVIGKSTVHLEKEINAGKVIIFRLPPLVGDEASGAIGRLLIATITGIAKNRSNSEHRKRKPTFLFIDEFQNYITDSLKTILAQARKRWLHLVLANQHLGQIDSDLQGEILANTDIKISGLNNPEMAKKVITSLNISTDEFSKLKEHEFYIKTNDRTALKVKPPGMLIKPKHYTTSNFNPYLLHYLELKELKRYQYEASGYYIPLASSKKRKSSPDGRKIRSLSAPKPKFQL